jgi:hypothetical protein
MKTYGYGCIDPHFLDLSTSWRWVVNFTPRPLYPQGKGPRYPLDRRLGGPQSRSGRFGEVKILTPTGIRTPTPRSSYTLVLTSLMTCNMNKDCLMLLPLFVIRTMVNYPLRHGSLLGRRYVYICSPFLTSELSGRGGKFLATAAYPPGAETPLVVRLWFGLVPWVGRSSIAERVLSPCRAVFLKFSATVDHYSSGRLRPGRRSCRNIPLNCKRAFFCEWVKHCSWTFHKSCVMFINSK